ncbi:unnamed protein product [Rotaria magnacalcarata]|uniref:Uncharacterized protein n=1 Tax=Rotaria magnacalcarata TaxID=392030 RepID=A0A820KZ44_9BILA|nr:unnamed protein product [Rotaria magnacalcarata]CAF2084123.1 unnamed protein product [Rotaria magnacalcarata]CAF4349447.1 unnamed protein product [Rotaria magnacalcarata]CAF5147947.1 unnamed protein product [Rotaria magnacalcarata]CAF5217065.1 unnamed protein product [Rotaria magnacalcarata]
MHSSSNGNNVDNTMHDTRKLRYVREMNRLRNRKYRKSLRGQFTSSSTSTSDTTIIGKDFDQLCGYMKHVNMSIGLSLENAVLNPRHLK